MTSGGTALQTPQPSFSALVQLPGISLDSTVIFFSVTSLAITSLKSSKPLGVSHLHTASLTYCSATLFLVVHCHTERV